MRIICFGHFGVNRNRLYNHGLTITNHRLLWVPLVRHPPSADSAGSLNLFWGFELYHHDDLTFDPQRPKGAFNSYTAFRPGLSGSHLLGPFAVNIWGMFLYESGIYY